MLKIKNWEKFQHYKSGRGAPPWIKLYRDLLNDKNWFSLEPSAAKFLISCWILAAEYDGYLPDSETLAFRLRLASKDVNKLLNLCKEWIIVDDSDLLAKCYQLATPETETETETETDARIVKKDILPDWIPIQEWNDWIGQRKKPTPRAIELSIAKLDDFRKRGIDIKEVLNNSTMNGWSGLFEPKKSIYQSNKPIIKKPTAKTL